MGAQFGRPANVVNMGMSDDDLADREVVLADNRQDVFDVIARVYNHSLAGHFIADYRAVATQRPNGEEFRGSSLACYRPV